MLKNLRRSPSFDDDAYSARSDFRVAALCTDIPDTGRPAACRRTLPSRGDASCSSNGSLCRRNDSETSSAVRAAHRPWRQRWGRVAAVVPRTNPEIQPREQMRRGRCCRRHCCRRSCYRHRQYCCCWHVCSPWQCWPASSSSVRTHGSPSSSTVVVV